MAKLDQPPEFIGQYSTVSRKDDNNTVKTFTSLRKYNPKFQNSRKFEVRLLVRVGFLISLPVHLPVIFTYG